MNEYNIGYFQTKSGLLINLVITSKGKTIGFVYDANEIIINSTLSAIKTFKNEYPNSIAVIVSPWHKLKKIDTDVFIINTKELV